MNIRRFSFTVDASDRLVERPSPNAAPTAFRIWKAGENTSDDGSIFFTAESAKALVDEQTARGRQYSIDFDHLSLITDRPATSGRAAGWHNLEVRQSAEGPELWAVDIEWCADVKAGLEEKPPRWRYFSPAFRTDKSGEVTSYVNFALCINPLTHQLPALASMRVAAQGDRSMNKAALLAALAIVGSADASDDDKKDAHAALAKHFADLPEDDKDKKDDGDKKDADGPAPDEKPEKKAEGDEPEKKAVGDKKDEPDAKSHAAKITGEKLEQIITSTVESQVEERMRPIELKALLDERLKTDPHMPESFRKMCLTQPSVAALKTILSATPKFGTVRHATAAQGDGSKTDGAAQLEGRDKEEMDRAMGITVTKPKMPGIGEDGRFTLHTVKPDDVRRATTQKGQ